MSSIKKYEYVKLTDTYGSFNIKKMGDVYDKRGENPDEPHRHDFYTILFVESAKGEHTVDFNTYGLGNFQIYFISPGQVHQLIEKAKPIGYVITFSEMFLVENKIDQCFIDDINIFRNYGESPPLQIDHQQFDKLLSYITQIEKENKEDRKYKYQIIGAWLKLFLIEANSFCTLRDQYLPKIHSGEDLMRKFRELVEKKYHRWHQVQQYADGLNVTADYLNRTIKSLMGTTAKNYLQKKILIEAKRLLLFTSLTSKEISYQLGFTEPGNFSLFFKRMTKQSPGLFRDSQNIGF